MTTTTDADLEKLAENMLIFDQLIANATTSTGSTRVDVCSVIDDVKLSANVVKTAADSNDVDGLYVNGDQILSPACISAAVHDQPSPEEGQNAVTDAIVFSISFELLFALTKL